MRVLTRPAARSAWWTPYVSLPAAFWLMLWLGINTGPWVFRHTPAGLTGWLHYARTTFPFFVCIAVVFSAGPARRRGVFPGPLKLWLAYGFIGLVAGFAMSPRPFSASYWAICYLGAFAGLVVYLRGGVDPLRRAVQLNYLTWVVTTTMLAIVVFVARDALVVKTGGDWEGYGVVRRMGGTAGQLETAMPRSSGIGRFAAVPAIVAFVALWRDRRWPRQLLWGLLLVASAGLVYVMQSRGATLSLAFALVVVVYCFGVRARLIGIAVLLLCGVAVAGEMIPAETIHRVESHMTRGGDAEQMVNLTGRAWFWEEGYKHIVRSPLIGYGFQADRYLGVGHIHNTYFYALITSGMLGTVPFGAGLLWAWYALLRAVRLRLPQRFGQQAVFAQTAGILAFFTARSIPEVCGAMFMVDLLVMLPAIAYICLLNEADAGPGMPRG